MRSCAPARRIALPLLAGTCVLAAQLGLFAAAQTVQNPAPAAGNPASPAKNPPSMAPSGAPNSPSADNPASGANDPASEALAPVVYKDDDTPGTHGYHYTFFGNAFFINDQGYLLTVAHVLETFRDGGQPYILVSRPNAPPRLIQIEVVAKDPEHDVAILRATPNPFPSNYTVSFVPLSSGQAVQGESVLALSVHPKQLQNAHSFELQREDFSPGTVLSFETTQLVKSGPSAQVFLLSHPVVKGQSGSPVMETQTKAVIGLVEGLWLRGTYSSMAKTSTAPGVVPGAAIPVQYAIALLKQNGVAWHAVAPLNSAPPVSSLK